MSNSALSPFLREQRNFPAEDSQRLQVEVDKAYLDIAQKVNSRTIGTYALNFAVTTGNTWYLQGQSARQQSLRQVYTVSASDITNGFILHGLIFSQIDRFVDAYGEYTDGTNYYGFISASSTAIAGQITFYISPTEIVFVSGMGAPTLTSGVIVLEWLSYP